jgi:hypothetical protein
LSAAIKKAALLATVEFKRAFGALAFGVKSTGEHGAAIGAARACYGADHAWRARAELIGARTALRRFAIMRAVFLVLLFRVAIAAVIILSIHKSLLQRAAQRNSAPCGAAMRASKLRIN